MSDSGHRPQIDAETPEPIWIGVTESGARWARALRSSAAVGDGAPNVRAVSLSELPSVDSLRAADRPCTLAIEITAATLPDVLTQLADRRQAREVCLVGLLGADFFVGRDAEEAQTAVLEAGASLVVDSPRRADRVLRLARRHAERSLGWADRERSIEQAVWRRLPWQSAPWEIRLGNAPIVRH